MFRDSLNHENVRRFQIMANNFGAGSIKLYEEYLRRPSLARSNNSSNCGKLKPIGLEGVCPHHRIFLCLLRAVETSLHVRAVDASRQPVQTKGNVFHSARVARARNTGVQNNILEEMKNERN